MHYSWEILSLARFEQKAGKRWLHANGSPVCCFEMDFAVKNDRLSMNARKHENVYARN